MALPDSTARQQLTNMLIVVNKVPVALNAEHARVSALIEGARTASAAR